MHVLDYAIFKRSQCNENDRENERQREEARGKCACNVHAGENVRAQWMQPHHLYSSGHGYKFIAHN